MGQQNMGQQNGTADKTLPDKTLPGKTLEDWRRQIDTLDSDLVRLLNQRASIACEIAVIKVAAGLPAYDGKREGEVLLRVAQKNTGPLSEQSITAIFHSIIQVTRRLGTQKMQEQTGQIASRIRSDINGG